MFTTALSPTTKIEFGSPLTLTCIAVNDPDVTNDLMFIWMMNGVEFTGDGDRVTISTTDEVADTAMSELIFTTVEQEDEGNYTCLVHNREPEDGVSSTTQLTVFG